MRPRSHKSLRLPGLQVNLKNRQSDAASADLSVDARHDAAHRMASRFATYESPEQLVTDAVARCSWCSLDDEGQRSYVVATILSALRDSTDARFVRELLGDEPDNRMTRMHAHGLLFSRATEAAWRLALGEEQDE